MAIQDLELAALIKAGIFRSKREAVEEAFRLLFATRPLLRLEAAIQLFKDEEVTLGRAAEMAGLTRSEFEAVLADRGIERVVACDSSERLERQVSELPLVTRLFTDEGSEWFQLSTKHCAVG
jgi:predicted HTH domain antitoxin